MNKNFNRIDEVDSVVGAFIFAERSNLLKLNGFDERFFFFSEDIDLCFRFKKNIGNVIYFPESSVVHLKGSTSYKSSWFKNKNRSVATIRFIQKHFSRWGKVVSLTFHYFGIIIRIPLFFILGLIKLNSQYLRKTWDYIRLLTIYPKNIFYDN